MLAYLPVPYDLESNKVVMRAVIEAHKALAELKGVARTIPNEAILINTLVLQEAKESSAIENIITTHDELFRADSFSEHISKETKEVLNYAQALKTGFALIKQNGFISNRMLLQVQEIIEQNKAGFRRVSGTTIQNTHTQEVIYTPPQSHDEILNLMSNLEHYINDTTDATDDLIRMAVIHYQFEKIHPFYDGNGRTGRILNILYLVLKNILDLPILYLSRYIIRHKSDYYRLFRLEPNQDTWTEWILFMLEGVRVTALETIDLIADMRSLMDHFKVEMKTKVPKIYSKDLLENLFKHPYTKIRYVQNDLGISQTTAVSYLKQLESIGLLSRHKVGVETFYVNDALYNLFLHVKKIR
jgi:Fic family protein